MNLLLIRIQQIYPVILIHCDGFYFITQTYSLSAVISSAEHEEQFAVFVIFIDISIRGSNQNIVIITSRNCCRKICIVRIRVQQILTCNVELL